MAALLDPYGSFSPKTASNTKSSYLQPPKLNNRDIKKHPKARAYEEDCVSLLAESRHENAPSLFLKRRTVPAQGKRHYEWGTQAKQFKMIPKKITQDAAKNCA
jgi:hypothetical protein